MTNTSVLTKNQKMVFGPKIYTQGGQTYRITAKLRFDDQCGNGHNTFSITGDIDRMGKNGKWYDDAGGCIHEELEKHFPELSKYIKWHLVSTDGPMHYIANTVYHVEQNKLDYASSSAVWPDATHEDLTAPGLEERLKARLPHLMAEFRADMESLGFIY